MTFISSSLSARSMASCTDVNGASSVPGLQFVVFELNPKGKNETFLVEVLKKFVNGKKERPEGETALFFAISEGIKLF